MKQEYYFSQMNKAQQAVYRAMLDGFEAISPEFSVPRLENRELTDIFFRLRLDHPMIFYVNRFSYRFTAVSDFVQMVPEYMFEKKKIKEHQKALEGRLNRLVRPAQNLSAPEKERYIHDFICANVTYDKLKKQYSHEIIGPLQQGIGVCEGIAKMVKILCDRLGLECLIAVSEANPERGIRYRHAWNMVKLDPGGQSGPGKVMGTASRQNRKSAQAWYHLDATFDNSLGRYGAKRFDYYNLDDKRIFKDHEPLLYPMPACSDGNHFYYRENRLSLTKIEDVRKRLEAVLRKKQEHFVFHWRGGYLTREVLEEILKAASETAAAKNQFVRLSVNLPQAVIELSLQAMESNGEICVESADEYGAGETEDRI